MTNYLLNSSVKGSRDLNNYEIRISPNIDGAVSHWLTLCIMLKLMFTVHCNSMEIMKIMLIPVFNVQCNNSIQCVNFS